MDSLPLKMRRRLGLPCRDGVNMCLKSVLFLLVIRLKNASYVNVYIHPEYYSSLKNYRFLAINGTNLW